MEKTAPKHKNFEEFVRPIVFKLLVGQHRPGAFINTSTIPAPRMASRVLPHSNYVAPFCVFQFHFTCDLPWHQTSHIKNQRHALGSTGFISLWAIPVMGKEGGF